MTREEAILCLKGMKNYARDTFTEQADWQTSLDMAIKALEQEPKSEWQQDHAILKAYSDGANEILDKIRAEMEQNAYPIVHGINNRELGMTLYGILEVIDKYKAESTKKMGMTNGEKMQRVYCCEVCEPTTKNDLGVDAVSRKDVHDMLENLPITVEDKWFNWLQKACMRLADLPSVTPQEPKIGHWIANAPQYDMLNPQYICSECGNAHTRITPYCEMCGAKMVELQESEDKE